MTNCIFCRKIAAGEGLAACTEMAVAFPDAFPVSPGHVLIVPRRHESNFFALSVLEQDSIWSLVRVIREELQASHKPGGYNVGANIGTVAGQTIDHAHVHLIPRYDGDVADPRGGVRWVVPRKVKYWEP